MSGTTFVEAPEQATARPPRRRPPGGATETLYFAYGSNLHIAQMAERCPGSHFRGKATLAGWRWQINQRGVANVVCLDPGVSPGCAVDGLVFSITPKDQRALDRSEGVGRGFYQKLTLRVCLEPHARFYNFKTSRLAEDPAMSTTAEDDGQRRERQSPPAQLVNALVYVSEGYTTDGIIRDEYIARMWKAVADAAALGVPRTFLDKFIVPHLIEPASITLAASREAERTRKDDAPGPSHRVALHALWLKNREPSEDARVPGFPPVMLEALQTNRSGLERTRSDRTVYVVVAKETHATGGGGHSFAIKATSHDPELASELAMKIFREAFSDNLPRVGAQGESAASLVGPVAGARKPTKIAWDVDGRGCLHLRVVNDPRIEVWVEMQDLLVAV